MSKKLNAAMMSGKVAIRNRTAGEVMLRYMDRNKKRTFFVLKPFATQELAPKLTNAPLLKFSNLATLVKKGSITIA